MDWGLLGRGPHVGDSVRVVEGSFFGLEGRLVDVIDARGLAIVEVSLLNRQTLVELEYWQIRLVDSRD